MASPFRVGELVTGEFFTDRSGEVKRILRALREPTRLLVYGERRMGKSSAVHQAAIRAREDDVAVVWVDMGTATSLSDVTRRIVAGVPYRWIWREHLQSRLVQARLRVEVRTDPGGNPTLSLLPEAQPHDEEGERERLRRILGALDQVASEAGKVVAVVLDEFQELEELTERGGWVIRDIMQNTHDLSYVCAGSRLGLIDHLIGPEGPLHRFFEPLNMGPLPGDHLAMWMESRMEEAGVHLEAGVGALILALVGPRTQDCLQLARAVFHRGLLRRSASREDVRRALRQTVMEDGDRFETAWRGLARSQQGVLRAVARGEEKLGSASVRARYDLPTTPAITKAVRALQDRGRLSTRDPLTLDDPFFREWVLIRAMPHGISEARVGEEEPEV